MDTKEFLEYLEYLHIAHRFETEKDCEKKATRLISAFVKKMAERKRQSVWIRRSS